VTLPARDVEAWKSPLRGLVETLTARVDGRGREFQASVRLTRGAYVALRRRLDGRRVVRIARALAPKDEKGTKLWLAELAIFRKQLGLEAWSFLDESPRSGVAAAFVEPESGA